MSVQTITTATEAEYRATISSYAGKGYSMVHNGATHATLSKKKPFNWVLAIVCLFIPILGWIALVAMIVAASRGSEVVEITLANVQAGVAHV